MYHYNSWRWWTASVWWQVVSLQCFPQMRSILAVRHIKFIIATTLRRSMAFSLGVCVCVRVCVCVCVCVHKLPATLMTMQLLCTLEHLWHNTYMFLVLKLIFKITDILAGTGKLLLFCRVLVTRTLTVVEDYSLMCYLGGNVVSSCWRLWDSM